MKLTVSEVANLSGISIRTLHYYDEIGLLKPGEVSLSGYRYYKDEQIALLQQIMFLRELDFPLAEIKKLVNENFDREKALLNQIKLLTLKRERLDRLIQLAKIH